MTKPEGSPTTFRSAGRVRSIIAVLLALGISDAASAQAIVRVGIVNAVSDAGFFIAEKRGYFRQEGLEVAFTSFNSAARMIAPLGGGHLDVGGGTVSAGLYNAVARGIKLRIVADKGSIAPGYAYSALLVRKDHVDGGRYKSYADLKGMKVAIGAQGTGTASALNEALKKGGHRFKDVEILDLGYPQHLVAYTNKAIDASITNEPTVTLAVRAGVAVRVAGNDEVYPGQQTAVVLYSEEFAAKRPSDALKFMRAYLKGVRDYNDALREGRIAGPASDDIIALLMSYTDLKDAEVYRQLSPNACSPDGNVNVDSLRKDLAFFRELNLIERGNIAVENVVDLSFAQKAAQELGPYRQRE
ncbi:MAG TPA: ABC transporter substrate-binding protein [Xanthobacteraceae bacterium]